MQIPVVATVSERAENHQNYKTPKMINIIVR